MTFYEEKLNNTYYFLNFAKQIQFFNLLFLNVFLCPK